MPLGTPGRPSPVVRLDPTAPSCSPSRSPSTRSRSPMVGLGGEVLERIRVDRPSGEHVGRRRSSPTSPSWSADPRPAADRRAAASASASRSSGVVRRSDGFVSMAPNLGWRDVPLGARLARALATARPDRRGQRRRPWRPRRAPARRRDRRRQRPVHLGRVRRGRRRHRRRAPLTGVAGYGGEIGHLPINPNGSACRCGSIGCWETEVGEAALLRLAGRPTGGGRAGVDAVLREAEAGLAGRRSSALDHVGRWLGIGLAGLINIFDPRADRARRPVSARIHPFVADVLEAELDRRALPAPRAAGPDRPGDARRRCPAARARPSWRSSRCSPIRRPGSAAPRDARRVASA